MSGHPRNTSVEESVSAPLFSRFESCSEVFCFSFTFRCSVLFHVFCCALIEGVVWRQVAGQILQFLFGPWDLIVYCRRVRLSFGPLWFSFWPWPCCWRSLPSISTSRMIKGEKENLLRRMDIQMRRSLKVNFRCNYDIQKSTSVTCRISVNFGFDQSWIKRRWRNVPWTKCASREMMTHLKRTEQNRNVAFSRLNSVIPV